MPVFSFPTVDEEKRKKEEKDAQQQQAQGAQGQPGQPGQPRIVGESQASAIQQGAPIIVADEPTNSLIIVTDKNTYQALEDLIKKLDVKKPQVLIKASIIEVKGLDKLDFGTELATIGSPGDNVRGFAGTSFGLSTLVDTDADGVPDARVPVETTGILLGLFKD